MPDVQDRSNKDSQAVRYKPPVGRQKTQASVKSRFYEMVVQVQVLHHFSFSSP